MKQLLLIFSFAIMLLTSAAQQCVLSATPTWSSCNLTGNPQTAALTWDLNIASTVAAGKYYFKIEVSQDPALKLAEISGSTGIVVATGNSSGGSTHLVMNFLGSAANYELTIKGVLHKCKAGWVTATLMTDSHIPICSVTQSLHTLGQNQLVLDNTSSSNGDVFFLCNDFNAFQSITMLPGYEYDAQIESTGTFEIVSSCAQQKWQGGLDGSEHTPMKQAEGSDVVVDKGISFYPNPVSSNLTIQGISGEDVMVTAYSISGQKVLEQSYDSHVHEINLNMEGLEPGAYLLYITESGVIHQHRVIKN